jgi:hypothetical protein
MNYKQTISDVDPKAGTLGGKVREVANGDYIKSVKRIGYVIII